VISALFFVVGAIGSPAGDASYFDASLQFEGKLLDQRFVELVPGGDQSLCVALRLQGGRRELRLYSLEGGRLDATPSHVIPVLEDVIAYGLADLRDEPGRELFFLTRSGAWSYSLTKEGYRGNIERLVEAELLYDVPDNRSLPFWEYVLPARGGDLLLLPGSASYSVFGPRASTGELDEREARYELRVDFWARPSEAELEPEQRGSGREMRARMGESRLSLRAGARDGVFLSEEAGGRTLLSDSKSYDAPALVDVDGDGELDLVAASGGELHVHLSRGGDLPSDPTRVEKYPEYLDVTDADLLFSFEDLDGDGRSDLLVMIDEEVDGFENGEKRLLMLVNDGRRLLPAEPRQVLRFEAALLRPHVADVNRDGRPDLVLRKFELPSMLETVTGLEFRLTHLVFLAEEGKNGLVERRPSLKQTEVFNENTVGDAIANRVLELDCSGDGVPDLVEVDLQGRIVIRRLTLDSGFFSGDTWALDEEPWKRFETRGATLSIRVQDANGDGLADILSPGEDSLTLFLSSRGR
jgi:hypothetical protein